MSFMLSRNASLMALGASAAHRFDASMAYGSTLESTIQFGAGFGVNAISTAMNATAINDPRTTPNIPPSRRSSQERPVHLNSLAMSAAISEPRITQPKKTIKNPNMFDAVFELI